MFNQAAILRLVGWPRGQKVSLPKAPLDGLIGKQENLIRQVLAMKKSEKLIIPLFAFFGEQEENSDSAAPWQVRR